MNIVETAGVTGFLYLGFKLFYEPWATSEVTTVLTQVGQFITGIL